MAMVMAISVPSTVTVTGSCSRWQQAGSSSKLCFKGDGLSSNYALKGVSKKVKWRENSDSVTGFWSSNRRGLGICLAASKELDEEEAGDQYVDISPRIAASVQTHVQDGPGLCDSVKIWQQLHSVLFNEQGAMGTLAVMILGFQMCPEAWAGTEVAQINVNSGLFDLGDWSDIQSGFAKAFLLIFFSEIGDKTFFIAALLATRKSGVAVFSGTFGALMAMTVISVCLGRAFHYIDGILPSFGDTKLPVDDIAAVILLIYFGVSTLIDAANMEDSDSGEEQQEAELAIASAGAGGAVAGTVAATFALVFVAEWGDKSFFSTIALAAASSPLGVVIGAIAGHGAATLLAVLGGSFLGNYVSEKVIAYVGGVLFLVFAGATVVEILN